MASVGSNNLEGVDPSLCLVRVILREGTLNRFLTLSQEVVCLDGSVIIVYGIEDRH
jgi:hypothetical protein